MPRLNHGTLLENLVVLEVTRALATKGQTTCEFASAFAMPPLTQWWHKTPYEAGLNPKLNERVVTQLAAGQLSEGLPASYGALLRTCLLNAPSLAVVPYSGDAHLRLANGGPSGALLAAMLRRHHGQALRIWSNDLRGSSGRYQHAVHEAATECLLTGRHASALVDDRQGEAGTDAFCEVPFPSCITSLRAWRRDCAVRIGFLDPDTYTGGKTASAGQVCSTEHAEWLEALLVGAENSAGILFFATQHAASRPPLVAAFHSDALRDYPKSVVFHHGNYLVGLKLRGKAAERALPIIVQALRDSWRAWSSLVGENDRGLACYVDGVMA